MNTREAPAPIPEEQAKIEAQQEIRPTPRSVWLVIQDDPRAVTLDIDGAPRVLGHGHHNLTWLIEAGRKAALSQARPSPQPGEGDEEAAEKYVDRLEPFYEHPHEDPLYSGLQMELSFLAGIAHAQGKAAPAEEDWGKVRDAYVRTSEYDEDDHGDCERAAFDAAIEKIARPLARAADIFKAEKNEVIEHNAELLAEVTSLKAEVERLKRENVEIWAKCPNEEWECTKIQRKLEAEITRLRAALEFIGGGSEGFAYREYIGPTGETVSESDDAHAVARASIAGSGEGGERG